MFRQDPHGPGGNRRREEPLVDHPHPVRLHHLHRRDRLEVGGARRHVRRIHDRLIGEEDVGGGERLAVVETHPAAQREVDHRPLHRQGQQLVQMRGEVRLRDPRRRADPCSPRPFRQARRGHHLGELVEEVAHHLAELQVQGGRGIDGDRHRRRPLREADLHHPLAGRLHRHRGHHRPEERPHPARHLLAVDAIGEGEGGLLANLPSGGQAAAQVELLVVIQQPVETARDDVGARRVGVEDRVEDCRVADPRVDVAHQPLRVARGLAGVGGHPVVRLQENRHDHQGNEDHPPPRPHNALLPAAACTCQLTRRRPTPHHRPPLLTPRGPVPTLPLPPWVARPPCRSGGTGRHAVLRGQWDVSRGGSTPPFGTTTSCNAGRTHAPGVLDRPWYDRPSPLFPCSGALREPPLCPP